MPWTLITGGAKRLGAAIVRTLSKEGRSCVIHYRDSKREAEQLKEEILAGGGQAETICGDFSTIGSTRSFLKEYLSRFEETEILINNVGHYLLGPASTTEPEAALELFQVNVLSALMVSQALLPSLKKYRGHIINLGMAGTAQSLANTHATIYNMTKLSLSMLTKSLAKELAPFHVAVNMVSPGYLENSIDLSTNPRHVPWGRPATLEEVAAAIRFLTSSQASYMTGQNLEISGGTRL
jgi:NAD(P)-dependent dehydrogenase (short-subunit alcohol dehydrogenase family)